MDEKRKKIYFTYINIVVKNYLWLLLIGISSSLIAQTVSRYEYKEPKMGTEFRLVLYTNSQAQADKAAQAAFQRIDALNKIFSDYEADSEVSRLSISAGSGQKTPVSKELWEVLSLGQQIAKKSKGAFDMTIGPLSKLWRRAIRQNSFPDKMALAAAQKKVGYKYLKLYEKNHSVSLKKAEMHLDLGGIAKGYTVDEVYKTLRNHDITTALVDGGGDIYAAQSPPDAPGWKVVVHSIRTRVPSLDFFDPETKTWSRRQDQEFVLLLNDKAIASSGNTYQYLELNGIKYSHIIDPHTGLGLTHSDIVNVQAPTCVLADALASALSVLPPKRGDRLLKKFKNCQWH